MELERMRELCHPGFICKLPPDLNNSRGVEKNLTARIRTGETNSPLQVHAGKG